MAVDAYLTSLTPVASPHLKQGKLSPQQEQGRELFTTASCISCHKPPLYTNLKQYDLGTTSGMDKGRKVDVPTLIEVWRTAPYLHDGRALTLRDVFSPANNPEQTHGDVQDLTSEQLDALLAYISTL
jgi:cytochrome c peroxidase